MGAIVVGYVAKPEGEAALARGIEEGVANSILVKVNQIGSLTETQGVRRRIRSAPTRPRLRAQ